MEERPLRVAVFSDSALPILNGVSVSIDSLVTHLRALGHSVHVFTSGYPGYKEVDPNVHRSFSWRTPLFPDYPLSIPPFFPYWREFKACDFDLVHTHTPFTVGMVGLVWARRVGIPVVSTYHTHYDKYTHYIPLVPKKIVRRVIARHTNYYYNRVQHVITPSESSSLALRNHGVTTPTTIVPTGIPQPIRHDREVMRHKLGAKADDHVVLYVGRVAVEKNLLTLLDAFARLLKSVPSAKLWVVGDGPARAQMLRHARDLGVGDKVRFFGFIPRDRVDEYYAAADVFAFCSQTETQGLVVVEAMAHGLPAVVIQGGGASASLRDDENGFVVSNNIEEFAGALRIVLTDTERAVRFSRSALATAEEMGVPKMVEKILGVYHGVLPDLARLEKKPAYVS